MKKIREKGKENHSCNAKKIRKKRKKTRGTGQPEEPNQTGQPELREKRIAGLLRKNRRDRASVGWGARGALGSRHIYLYLYS
jgi:hypothetical protein